MQKKHDVKHALSTGWFRLLRTATLTLPLLALPAPDAEAASWQWGVHSGRERIVVELDAPQAQATLERVDSKALLLRLATPVEKFSLQGPPPAAQGMVSGLSAAPEGVTLTLRTPAFGYLVTKPHPRQLVIDIFHDPLGARWTASGILAPAAVGTRYSQPLHTATENSAVVAPAAPDGSAVSSVQAVAGPVSSLSPAVALGAESGTGSASVIAQGHEEADTGLPELAGNASLRPEMRESTPTSLPQPGQHLAEAREKRGLLHYFLPGSLAEAAEALLTPSGRGTVVNPQEVFGKINTGGPEAWPNAEALSTSLQPVSPPAATPDQGVVPAESSAASATPAPAVTPEAGTTPAAKAPESASTPAKAPESVSTPAASVPPASTEIKGRVDSKPGTAARPSASPVPTAPASPQGEESKTPDGTVTMRQTATPLPSANATGATNATRPVIYVDEAGNVVPKPPEPDKMLADAERLLESTQYKEALVILEELKALHIPPAMREKVLYLISDATESLYVGEPLKGFEPITATTSEAMNANLRSTRVPDALFRLGMAHLRVDNFNEAEGYFKALKRRFPYDINVPAAFVNLGKGLLAKNLYEKAAEHFRSVLQEYPEANVLREAAVGLVRSLVRLGDMAQAALITDFVDKRWPRHYLSDPGFLEVTAELSLRFGKMEDALQQYWLHYNLDPTRNSNPAVLGTIGDIYLRTGRPQAAMEIFKEIRERYPDSEAAGQALMRLSEKGIYDGPVTVDQMFKVFENAGDPLPPVAYKDLRASRPQDKRAVLAGLKLAMWELWKKQYTDAMGAAADFIDAYPEHPDVEQAREVIMRAFMADLKNSLAEENYGRVLILWNGFPLVRERYGPMDAPLRNALGRGYLERGEDDKALDLFAEFLKTPKDPNYSDATFALYFNKYLQAGNWNALLDLGDTVKGWNMDPKVRGQLDYALALSAENLGLAPKALPLWKQLADNTQIPLYQRAYATYFLAKDAERRKDIREAYTYNKDTLQYFTQLEQERSDKADPERLKEAIGSLMDITEVANRIPESLEWLETYNHYVPEDSSEYPGLRFREARLHRKLGDNAKAKALLEVIVKKAPDSPFAKAAETELRTFSVSRDLQNFLPPGK